MYLWIKAAFQHFFNNVQKGFPVVQVEGLRACRQLLAYLLREVSIQRQRLLDGQPTDDTMLTRLVHFQLGRSAPTVEQEAVGSIHGWSAACASPRDVIRTIVGAVAGQEESDVPRHGFFFCDCGRANTRLTGTGPYRYGNFCRGQSSGDRCAQRFERQRMPHRAAQILPRSAAAAATGRGPAPEMRAGQGVYRRQPADPRGHADLCFTRLGDEGRARTRRLHPRSAARALFAARLGAAHVPRAARAFRHHRRVDGRVARAP